MYNHNKIATESSHQFLYPYHSYQLDHEYLDYQLSQWNLPEVWKLWRKHPIQQYNFYEEEYSGCWGNLLFSWTLYFGHTNELRDYCFSNSQQRKFLFAALRRFVLGAARLVVFRLVGCLRRNGLARCWNDSVSLDVWGKYSRPPCSFVCLVFVKSRRYLH